MSRPRFVLVGVPKAGTTSLHHYLGQHPALNVSKLDEVNFLSYPGPDVARSRYPRMSFPITTLEEYDALFADAHDRVSIDFTASCFTSAVAVDRIRSYLSDPGLLVLLRDPCDRAYSAYLHRVRKGYEHRSPSEALVSGEPTVDLGFYAARIAELQSEFGPDKVRIWLLDDLRSDPAGTTRDVLSYLGVDPNQPLDTATVRNQARVPRSALLQRLLPDHRSRRTIAGKVPESLLRPARWAWERAQRPADPLAQDVESRLRALYASDVRRLETLVNRDLSHWIGPTLSPSPSGSSA